MGRAGHTGVLGSQGSLFVVEALSPYREQTELCPKLQQHASPRFHSRFTQFTEEAQKPKDLVLPLQSTKGKRGIVCIEVWSRLEPISS